MVDFSLGKGRIYAKHQDVGVNVRLDSDIGSEAQPCEYVQLGDNVWIHAGCRLWAPRITIRDYTKIHRNSLLYGRNPVSIGYNCWFGEGTIIDCEGSTRIGDNVGVGAHSQLWSHIRHGDVMMGCRYLSFGTLNIMNDAWLVGHCMVSPVTVGPCSMALMGSVITKDMAANHVYGGSPAVDLTDKLGPPFQFTDVEFRYSYMKGKLEEFMREYGIRLENAYGGISIVKDWVDDEPYVTQFNVATRQYRKRGNPVESWFMQYLLPEAKFVPVIG